jgi:hypothetical protein
MAAAGRAAGEQVSAGRQSAAQMLYQKIAGRGKRFGYAAMIRGLDAPQANRFPGLETALWLARVLDVRQGATPTAAVGVLPRWRS